MTWHDENLLICSLYLLFVETWMHYSCQKNVSINACEIFVKGLLATINLNSVRLEVAVVLGVENVFFVAANCTVRIAHVYISYSARASQSHLPHSYLPRQTIVSKQCLSQSHCSFRTSSSFWVWPGPGNSPFSCWRSQPQSTIASIWEHGHRIVALCLVVNLLGWGRKARIADTSCRHAKKRTTTSRGLKYF